MSLCDCLGAFEVLATVRGINVIIIIIIIIMLTKEAMIHYGCCSARLPLDEKLFERDLQAALQMSKQSTEDDKDVITGLMDEGIITLSVAYIIHII